MELTLESLGITKEELTNRVVEQLVNRLLENNSTYSYDEEYSEYCVKIDTIEKKFNDLIKITIDKKVEDYANENLLPVLDNAIENICLQETNEWGQKKGESKSLLEYLIQRSEYYMTEKVDSTGKTQQENNYGWRPATTRISYMISDYLHHEIDRFVKTALKTANSSIVKGIEEAVKIKLQEVLNNMEVKTII